MATAPQTGMDKSEYKMLLTKSKKEPVNFCFAQGQDQGVALLVLSRNKQGKAVEKELTKDFPEAKNARYGTALVDVDDNPKLVKFIVNKPVSSMAKRLAKTLKGTGFNKVEILLEDGSPVESFAEEDDTAGAPAPADVAPVGVAQPGVVPPAPPPPPAQTAKPDAAELTRLLAAQIKRIPEALAVAPGLKEALSKFATDANVNIKTNNLVYAATSIEQLRRALDDVPQAAPPPPPPAPDAAKPNAGALAQALAEQIKRIPGVLTVAPGLKDQLSKLATDANVNIKTGNLTYAATYIESLKRALDGAAQTTAPAAAAAADGGKAVYEKSRAAWLAARGKVQSELAKLRGEIEATYAADGLAAELGQRYDARVAPVLEGLDESLADKLDEAAKATDAPARAKLVAQAKDIMKGYEAFLTGEPIIADLDANPFVPLAIQKTVTATLAALAKTVQ